MTKRKIKTTNLNVNEYLIIRLSTNLNVNEYLIIRLSTNLNVNEYIIVRLSTEIDTNENRGYYSMFDNIFRQNESHENRWYYNIFNKVFRQNESHDFNIVYESDLNWSATCGRSMVFSWYFVFFHQSNLPLRYSN
jgi:hypothetical protein